MTRIAIFVEGQTELIFVDRLLQEMAHCEGLAVEHAEATGGSNRSRRIKVLKAPRHDREHQTYVLIVNCGGDSKVKSDILERYGGLQRAGYSMVLGLRDVYGQFRYDEVPRLREALQAGLPRTEPSVDIILAVMEIEAWFLAEYNHFSKLNPALTPEWISKRFGFNPATDDLQQRPHPAEDLDRLYREGAGFSYNKQRNNVQRTVGWLDFDFFLGQVRKRFPDLDRFITTLERVLC